MITSSLTAPQEKAVSKRVQVIDALRGFALFGILLTHSIQFYDNVTLEPNLFSGLGNLNIDIITKKAVQAFASDKLYSIFSFLFGLSFAIQLQSAASKGKPFIGRFIWRLTILLTIGYFHSLLYPSEILQIYAVLGLVLVACAHLKNSGLLLVGGLFFLAAMVMEILGPELAGAVNALSARAENSSLASFMGLHRYGFSILTGRLFVTVSLFLLGLYAGRKSIFSDTPGNRMLFRKILVWSVVAALVSIAAGWLVGAATADMRELQVVLSAVKRISLSFLYVALLVKLYQDQIRPFYGILQRLVPVGQMGLSVYIMQSLLLTPLYSLGRGTVAGIGLTAALGITVVLFLLQVLLATWWMSRYRFGPLEWLWRTLIYFEWQPIRKSSTA